MAEIHVAKIDATGIRDWDLISDVITQRHIHSALENMSIVCSSLLQVPGDVRIIKRIGSQSGEGEVYLVAFSSPRSSSPLGAMKIMPYVSVSSKESISNEISIATMLSNEVVEGRSSHFPVVFSYAFVCDDVETSPYVSSFIDDAREYAAFNEIYRSLGRVEAKRFLIHYTTSSDKNHFLDESARKYNVNISSVKPKVAVMISELAWGDVRAYFELRRPTIDIVRKMINDIFSGIDHMHSLGIFHGDLHTGNVLVTLRPNGEYGDCLIHDFGRSTVGNISKREIYTDKITILETMEKCARVCRMNDVVGLIEEMKSSLES
jgi:serine/threonine protein kinase